LLKACLTLPNLHTINLNDNAFGLNTVEPLRAFISSHTPLQHLILNNNGLGPHAGIIIATALTELAAKKAASDPKLETVICGRNRLESGSMAYWARAFAANPSVKTVRMIQNGIRPDGVEQLLRDGLKYTTELEVLSLQDNTFTIKGSLALASVLPLWPNIKELDVSDGLLGSKGCIATFQTLAKGKHAQLEVLRLQYNDVTSKGLEVLAAAAKNSLPKLRRVELNGNKFSEEDTHVETLRELLEERKPAHDVAEDYYGLDELDELESEEEDEEAEEEEEEKEVEERILAESDAAAAQNVPETEDADVDQLAQQLDQAGI
jgi:Ran GTPase-activating protein 1